VSKTQGRKSGRAAAATAEKSSEKTKAVEVAHEAHAITQLIYRHLACEGASPALQPASVGYAALPLYSGVCSPQQAPWECVPSWAGAMQPPWMVR